MGTKGRARSRAGKRRCPEHGLIAASDGTCALCRQGAGRSQTWRRSIALFGITTLLAGSWYAFHRATQRSLQAATSSREEAPPEPSLRHDPRRDQTKFADEPEAVPVATATALAAAPRKVPPAPPGLSIDPEDPPPPDDPNDFVVPRPSAPPRVGRSRAGPPPSPPARPLRRGARC